MHERPAQVVTDQDLATTFLDHVDADRDWAATRLGLDLLEEAGPDALVDELLVPTMERTGVRWHDGTYTVADEHHVTGLVEELLGAATVDAQPDRTDRTVLVTCADGERHALPSRMLTLQLRARGQHVRYIGASLPAAELESSLRSGGIEALLVSCTLTAALTGVADMVAVAHRTGVPVLVGGGALRQYRGAAAMFGADGAAGTVDEAVATLERWRTDGVPTRLPADLLDPTGERDQLAPTRAGLVQAVMDVLPPGPRPTDAEDVESLVRMLEVSLLLGTSEALTDHVDWLKTRHLADSDTSIPVDRVLETMRTRLPRTMRRSRSYVSEAAARTNETGAHVTI